MTALRQSAMMELEKIPEDKLSFVIQIMQGVNGLYNDTNSERKEAFARLEQLRKKGTVTDDAAELASYTPPLEGFSRPIRVRIVVDFPAPLGPIKPKTSPCSTVKLMFSIPRCFP